MNNEHILPVKNISCLYGLVHSAVSPGVPVLVALLVTTHNITVSVALNTGAVDFALPDVTSMFPVKCSVGSAISDLT